MNLYRDRFGDEATLIPVIHVTDLEQARRNVGVARELGCDGVFLIGHRMSQSALLEIYAAVRGEHPDWWIGLNLLGETAFEDSQVVPVDASALWVDNAGIVENGYTQFEAETIWRALDDLSPRPAYFGGVAFKYQPRVYNLEAAAASATLLMDVVVTTGPGTGEPADLKKVRRMRSAMGDAPLALASGVTPENVRSYLPDVDCFMVASSITDPTTEDLIPCEVRRLLVAMSR